MIDILIRLLLIDIVIDLLIVVYSGIVFISISFDRLTQVGPQFQWQLATPGLTWEAVALQEILSHMKWTSPRPTRPLGWRFGMAGLVFLRVTTAKMMACLCIFRREGWFFMGFGPVDLGLLYGDFEKWKVLNSGQKMGNSADPIWQPLWKINQDLLWCWVFSHPEFIHELVVVFFFRKTAKRSWYPGRAKHPQGIHLRPSAFPRRFPHFSQKKSAWWFQPFILFSIGHIWDI